MRAVIQRVRQASVTIDEVQKAAIGSGLLILLGIESSDGLEDIEWLCQKIVQLRIFDDAQNLPNLSVQEIAGEILLVSQFTLHASTRKGNRPGYSRAATPAIALPLYEKFVECLQQKMSTTVQTGKFGANMNVSLTNDGPVTILIDTKNKE